MSFRTYGVAALRRKVAVAMLLGWSSLAQAEPVEIVALGDSLTQGYGLPRAEGFVPQLQAWLRARGHDVTLVNAGVSGDTTAGGLSRVAWSLQDSTDAMIVTLGGNDLLRGIDPANSRANLDGILQVTAEQDLPVLLVGLRAPGNYGPAFKRAFDSMYPDLAEQYGTLYFAEFFEGLAEEERRPADVRAYMQADGIHPNAEGVRRIVAALGPSVEALILRAQK
ncbi:arylesterase [Puniceibacterium confluentis]|uniref:arylesterase n=1 Tax=Puniceibacterium confluentis TaxID=1958944 RepID=UPI001647EE2B|nr:arylesterase [Puniceibacterium confluentis]